MATDQNYIAFVLEQAGAASGLTARKMFGEYALYLDGKVVALVCDNQVFLKPTEAGRAMLERVSEHPPYPGAKPHFRLDDEIDDAEFMRSLFEVTARALPMPKPKRVKGIKQAD